MWLQYVVAALACYRATRLVTGDAISEPIREWADARGPRIGYLASCDWCLSVWVSIPIGVAVVWHVEQPVVWFVLVALALSAVTGVLAGLERNDR